MSDTDNDDLFATSKGKRKKVHHADIDFLRGVSKEKRKVASQMYHRLILYDFDQKKISKAMTLNKALAKKRNKKSEEKVVIPSMNLNVKFTFQKELDVFIKIYPSLVRIAALTESMKAMKREDKKEARAEIAALREKNSDLSEKNYEKYFAKLHRVFSTEVYRVKATKKGDKKEKSRSIIDKVEEKDLLLVISIEKSFEKLCKVIDE